MAIGNLRNTSYKFVPVSVLLSLHPKEKPAYLYESLNSIFLQSFKPFEVIILIDGKINSQLFNIIKIFISKLNLRIYQSSDNLGLAISLNSGFPKCKYNLIVRFDTDDICLPRRLFKQYNFMKHNPEVGASSGSVLEIDEKKNFLRRKVLPTNHITLLKYSIFRSPLNHPATILRKNFLSQVGGYPSYRLGQDYALWSLFIVNNIVISNLPDKLIYLRIKNQSKHRRGILRLKNEIRILFFQYHINFHNIFTFNIALISRIIFRLSPHCIIQFIYRNIL